MFHRASASRASGDRSGGWPWVSTVIFSVQVRKYMQYAAICRPHPITPIFRSTTDGPSQSGQCQMLVP
jgi:hypothetical protein